MLRWDCVNFETHTGVTDFQRGPGGLEAHPAHGCAVSQMELGGCPERCSQYRRSPTS